MQKHFITFLSPGTFFSERTEKEIDSWNPDKGKSMAYRIKERYGATPYGFYFTTRERKDTELDSKVIKTSGTYFLGGRILTLADVKREMPKEKTLISNMEGNGYERVIVNMNSWKSIHPFGKEDVLLDFDPQSAIPGAVGEHPTTNA